MEQVAVELVVELIFEHIQIRGKKQQNKKKKSRKLHGIAEANMYMFHVSVVKHSFIIFYNVNVKLLLMLL